MMVHRAALIAMLLLGCPPALAAAQPVDIETGLPPALRTPEPWTLPPPPSEEEQAQARVMIDRLLNGLVEAHGDEPAGAISHLRDLARSTDDDPAARFVLLRMALDLTVKSGDYPRAHEIIADLAQHYRVDSLRLKVDALVSTVKNHTDHETIRAAENLKRAIGLLEEALHADRMGLAEELLALASAMAEQSADHALVEDVGRWRDLWREWSAHAEEAGQAALRILQEPADADARLAVGRYLCFTKGDWSTGLPMLARSSDETLRTLAKADLRTRGDQHARIAVADGWRDLAKTSEGLAHHRMIQHAEEIYRRVYPAVTGLARLKMEQKMISRPLFVFDSGDPPSEHWMVEHLHFRGGHGREGSGSWANLTIENDRAILVANRAGFIETLEQFPPPGVDHYQIEAELWSDLLVGTALEFGGQRMYFGHAGGIHLEGGWVPNVIYPIRDDRFYHYLIDISPEGISFTVNGVFLGTMKTDGVARGGIVLRGWKGHVRCRRLVVWALPGGDITSRQDGHRPP